MREEFVPALTAASPWLKRLLIVGTDRQHVKAVAAH
jgi:hypothetical protein